MFNDNTKTGDAGQSDIEAAAVASTRAMQGATAASDALDAAAKNGINVFKTAGELLGSIGTELNNIFSIESNWERLKLLDKQSAEINQALGLGTKKAGEFKQLLADSFPKFAELGLDISEVQKQYVSLSEVFGSNISITDERMAELAATAKVTGVSAKDLASSFRSVGGNLSNVADKMMVVTKVAKESGVIVRDVADKVTKNIGQMNMYNFDGGIKGLAKMSSQASKLGIDMGSIFKLTEKVFNPEGAIETAAALQRLGVQTSALTDPLKLMDLSANDPTELQNQIVKMSKDFVSFNKNLGEFQIMPGEKRRLREVADALGMTSDELAKMSLNASNLDYKMKQIKFAPGTSKEDREMIASMAQINKKGMAEVKVKQMKEVDGKQVFTGEYEMVEVGKLTTDQLKLLKESQELQGASMETIAIDQLSELASLNAKMSEFLTATRFGAPSGDAMQGLYSTATTGTRKAVFTEYDNTGTGIISKESRETENTRDFVNKMTNQVDDIFSAVKKKISEVKSMADVETLFTEAATSLGNKFTELKNTDILDELTKFMNKKNIKSSMISGSNTPNSSNTSINTSNSAVSSSNIINNPSTTPASVAQNKPLDSNVNLSNKVDVNVTMDPLIRNEALTTLMSDAIRKYYEDPSKMAEFIKKINDIQTNNNLIPAWHKP
jgi:hypothetical protein